MFFVFLLTTTHCIARLSVLAVCFHRVSSLELDLQSTRQFPRVGLSSSSSSPSSTRNHTTTHPINRPQVDNIITGDMSDMIDPFKQANGCPIPATWFTLAQGTDCAQVKKRYARGDEISCHTMTHRQLNLDTSKQIMEQEIVGSREFLINKCGIPASQVVGFRNSYLITTPMSREVMHENGFLYDSSNTFDWNGEPGAPANRSWPFTMDEGLPDNSCAPTDTFQACTPDESYPGLWEIPVWEMQYQGQSYGMDPGADSPGNGAVRPTLPTLKYNFDEAYGGNRAPLGIYVHVGWFSKERIAGTQAFIKYAMAKPDVWFVTMHQLVQWMQDPVPSSEMAGWLAARCKNSGHGPAIAPTAADPPTIPVTFLSNDTSRFALMGRRRRMMA